MPNRENDHKGMGPEMHVVHGSGRQHGRTVLEFKGQGFVKPGIGHDLFKHHDRVKELYKRADEILEDPISIRSFEDPYGDLTSTKQAQRATIVVNHANLIVGQHETESGDLQPGAEEAALGNSLGEYSALIAAGALTFEAALLLIKLRSQYMQDAQNATPGSLAAPLFSKNEDEREKQQIIVSEVALKTGIVVCLYNTRRQTVYGGTLSQLSAAEDELKTRGMKLTKLHTDGAFHHPTLMLPAKERLDPEIDKADIRDARIPVYANATGEKVKKSAAIRQVLKGQMIQPVQYVKSLEGLLRDGFDVKVELGDKPSFTNMAKDHPLLVGAVVTPILTATGLVIGHALYHPNRKK